MHSLFLRGHELGGGGHHVTHSSHNSTCFIYFFLFIRNIPKRINYIIKYSILILTFIDYVDLVGDGQSILNNVIY